MLQNVTKSVTKFKNDTTVELSPISVNHLHRNTFLRMTKYRVYADF